MKRKPPKTSTKLLRRSHKMASVCHCKQQSSGPENGPAVYRVFVDCGGVDGHDPGTGLESIYCVQKVPVDVNKALEQTNAFPRGTLANTEKCTGLQNESDARGPLV